MAGDLRNAGWNLFLISFLILFFELTCIRWFPANVLYLTFFTNIILLACFVGMSIGCLTAKHARNHLLMTPFWMLIAFGAGFLIALFHKPLATQLDVGNQKTPEVVFFGTEPASRREFSLQIPIELFAAVFFVLVVLMMLGPGQELGRAFNRIRQRGTAYAINLLGSVVGIGLFALCSWFQLTPGVWLTIIVLILIGFLYPLSFPSPRWRWWSYFSLFLVVLIGVQPQSWFRSERMTFWSPYYRVDFYEGYITTNLIGHQQLWEIGEGDNRQTPQAYAFPHLLNQHSGQKPFERVLIIGAGSGNDLSRALQWGSPTTKIEAVEIDPVIQRIGKELHPNQPYSDSRVNAILGDGRNYLRRTAEEHPGEYDAVIFAVVDSLVLHSGYSNIRLESFLFTQQSFQDVKKCLKPNGKCFVYNYFRQGWIVARLRDILRSVFENDPVIVTIPPKEKIDPNEIFDGFTLFIAGSKEATEPIQELFSHKENYRIRTDIPPAPSSEFRDAKLWWLWNQGQTGEFLDLYNTKVGPSPEDLQLATDDWPFLYQRSPGIPNLTWHGMAIMLVLTLGLMWFFLREKRPINSDSTHQSLPDIRHASRWFDSRMFFLGAGFMLIETKAVVHMALVFGSTWMVNVFVFLAVLLMALFSNFLAIWLKPKNLTFFYIGLFLTLGLNLFVPLDSFLGLDRTIQMIGACILVFAPIFFAGIIFATSFARSANPDRAFGFNIFGALIGGLSENFSMVLGFRYLLLVAVGFYFLSIFQTNQSEETPLESRADV